jgi:hypothetical protein
MPTATPYPFATGSIDAVRVGLATELSRFYGELSNVGSKPAPKFSLSRVLSSLSDGPGLLDGYEREVCSGAAIAAGEHLDKHAPIIPWSALGPQRRDASVAGTGHYLMGVDVASAADILRPWSVCANAGVTFFENLTANLTFPRVTSAVSGAWVSDEVGTGGTEGDVVFGQVALVPKTWIGYTQYSRLFRLQAAQGEEFLRQQLLRAAGSTADKAVLGGVGGAEPIGLFSWPGLGTQSGTSLGWAGVTNMIETCATAGADDAKLAFVSTPAVRELLQNREVISTAGRFVWDDDKIASRAAYATPDCTASAMLVGDWSKVAVGIWGSGLRVAHDPASNFPAGIEALRIMLVMDCGLLQPSAFCKSTSIT